jgi:hypothetical protein
MQRELIHFAANARTTNCAAFIGEPYDTLVPATRANNADETSLDDAAIEDALQLTPNEARQIDI